MGTVRIRRRNKQPQKAIESFDKAIFIDPGHEYRKFILLITWLIYATLLHLRMVRGWQGRRIAYFSILGLVAILITYFGVKVIFSLTRSYNVVSTDGNHLFWYVIASYSESGG